MTIQFRYDLDGHGWADCTVQIGDNRVTASASYLTDALGDFASAMVALLRGESHVTATFAEEPGEFRWEFDRHAADRLRVRLFWNGPRWEERAHDPASAIFDAECRLRTFVGQVLAEFQRLLATYGEAGYRERWGRDDFPTERIAQIERLLAEH